MQRFNSYQIHAPNNSKMFDGYNAYVKCVLLRLTRFSKIFTVKTLANHGGKPSGA